MMFSRKEEKVLVKEVLNLELSLLRILPPVDVLVAVGGSFPPRWPFLDAEKIPEARDPLDRCWNTLEE